MIRQCLLFLVATATLLLAGCASDTPDANKPDSVRTIPWNRPERWESQGPMGGMLNTR